MPVIQGQTSIAAASTTDNLLTGTSFMYMPYNGLVRFGLTGDANAANLTLDVYTGSDVIAEAFEPAPTAKYPVDPDDFALEDIVMAGELVKVGVRNKHASTATVLFHTIKITPL